MLENFCFDAQSRAYRRDVAIDIETVSNRPDPYPTHAELRERGAHQLDDGRWIVARADDVERVLADTNAIIGFAANDAAATVQSRMARFTDGPAHAERRAVATAALRPLEPTVIARRASEIASERLASLDETQREIDIMSSLARAVPVATLAGALGIEASGAVEAAVELALAIAPPRGSGRGDAEAPLRHLCSTMDGVPLSDDEINTAALLFQAVDATAGLIGNSVVTWARLGWPADAGEADFVREVSRLDPAVHFTTRRAEAEIDLGTARIPADSTVLVDLAAAGRDPARWADADEFRPSRTGPSFAFGDGIHRCPGSDHALALAAGVVTAIRRSGGHLAGADIAYEPRFNLRIPTALTWIVGARRDA